MTGILLSDTNRGCLPATPADPRTFRTCDRTGSARLVGRTEGSSFQSTNSSAGVSTRRLSVSRAGEEAAVQLVRHLQGTVR